MALPFTPEDIHTTAIPSSTPLAVDTLFLQQQAQQAQSYQALNTEWSVALQGYYRDDPNGVDIKRPQPGDVIGFPFVGPGNWTPKERSHFLIININGPTFDQMSALCERELDLGSYRKYEPLDYDSWAILHHPTLDKPAKLEMYDKYFARQEYKSSQPVAHWRKRRFNISLQALTAKGVDTARMLDKTVEYSPTVNIDHTELFDKLLQRDVLITDELEQIKPRTIEEILEDKTAEEILADMRT